MYEKFLAAAGDRRLFLTYDRGKLEIMAPSRLHERPRRRIGRMIDVLTEEMGIPCEGCGMTTFRRQGLARGLEADECYYLANAERVRGQREIDLGRDPPPDLALEVEATRSALDRMGVYAALGVPEVWRYDGEALHVYRLRPDGEYELTEQSLSFPSLPLPEFVEFLHRNLDLDETSFVRAFRKWVRKHALPPKKRRRKR